MMKTQAQISYEKGKQFEDKFAEYCQTDLGYPKVKTRKQLTQFNNARGINVDVVGERLDARGKQYNNMGIVYFIVFTAMFFLCIFGGLDTEGDNTFLKVSIFGEVSGVIALILSNKFNVENIWVECKCLQTKVTIKIVQDVLNQYSNYVKSGDTTYKFKEVVIVSKSGFVDNAIELAIKSKIKCYTLDGKGKFVKIDNWS